MNNKILTIVLSLFLIATGWMVVQMMESKGGLLVSSVSIPTPQPSNSSYNPSKEIKYDSSTDLKKELDSVDPKVLDEDFQELNN